MGSLKTISLGLVLICGLNGPSQAVDSADPTTRLQFFASCAGRLSALMEHQWMFDGTASEHTKSRRANVLEILQAMMPPDAGRSVLNWRIDAKMAHASLLTRATFNDNAADAQRAAQVATRMVAQCDSVLLG
ncbi:hypothetical protein [Falsiphaeobacter marinintestinus]|uniref:hypothetical protein n=1 Tax=Falsiphaeobacter marinintestinus TaxID=1492905 RepID=UPI0011B3B537|nr:hypothetical protein [Phaeobacter marinintestinus]